MLNDSDMLWTQLLSGDWLYQLFCVTIQTYMTIHHYDHNSWRPLLADSTVLQKGKQYIGDNQSALQEI